MSDKGAALGNRYWERGGLVPVDFCDDLFDLQVCLFNQLLGCKRVKYRQGATNQQADRFLREGPGFQT